MATGEYGRKEAEQAYRLFESMYEQIAGRRPFTRDTEITERAESAGSYGRRTPNDVVKLLERLINQGVAIDDAASYLLEAAQAYPPVTSGYGMAYYTPTQLVTAYERYAQGGMEGTPYEGAVAAETGNVPRATGRTADEARKLGEDILATLSPFKSGSDNVQDGFLVSAGIKGSSRFHTVDYMKKNREKVTSILSQVIQQGIRDGTVKNEQDVFRILLPNLELSENLLADKAMLDKAIAYLYIGNDTLAAEDTTSEGITTFLASADANTVARSQEILDSLPADVVAAQVAQNAAAAPEATAAEDDMGIPSVVPVPAEAPISVKNIVASGVGVYLGQDPTTNNYRVGIDDGRGGFAVQEVAPAGEFIVPDEAAGQTYTASLTPAAQGIGFAPTGEFPAAESPQSQTFAGLGIGDALSIWQMNANAENRRIQNEQNRIINQYNADAAEATAQYRGDVLRQNAELDKLNRRLQWDLNSTVSAGTQAQIDAANERWKTVSANTQAQLDQQKFQFENISATDAANLAERERAARAGEAGATFRQRIATQPALEQQSLARMTRLDDLLSDGGNYLARAFAQYGMTPPTAQPTLADRVNETVRGEIIQANADKKAAYDEAVAGLIAAEYEKARDTAEQSAWDAYVAANTEAGTPYVPAQYDDASFRADLQARRAENRAILENEAMQNWAATLAGEGVPDFVTAKLEEAGEIDDFEKAAAALEAGHPYAGLRSYGEALPTREDSQYLLSEAQAATGGGFTGQSREDWRSGFTFDTQPEWAKGLTPTQREAFGLPSAPEYEAVPPETSMEALVGQARGFLSPAASDVYFGAAARPKTGIGFALPSYQQVQRLDPEQRDALNTALLTEFNIPLDVAMHEERLRGMGARTSAPAAFAARPTQMFRQTPFRTTPTGLRESTAAIPADRFTPRRRTTPVQPAMFRPA